MYPYNSDIYLREVALNVRDLGRQTGFYHQILGMDILEERDQEVLLGVGHEPLVRLLATNQAPQKSYGLYHMAILLPDRQALADVLKHLAELHIPLVGGADHGYSEALYLEDLEGNGIELYADKALSFWDIKEDGRIIGVTEELASQNLYDFGRGISPFKLAPRTRMGHVHLSVSQTAKAKAFYMQVLGLSDKFSISRAAWLASGDYHHHFAVNEWAGPDLERRQAGWPGLAYAVVKVAGREDLARIAKAAQTARVALDWHGTHSFFIRDEDGISLKIVDM